MLRISKIKAKKLNYIKINKVQYNFSINAKQEEQKFEEIIIKKEDKIMK